MSTMHSRHVMFFAQVILSLVTIYSSLAFSLVLYDLP